MENAKHVWIGKHDKLSNDIYHNQAFDILKKYWEDWFKQMKVKNYKIVKTDLPINHKKIIEDFIENNGGRASEKK